MRITNKDIGWGVIFGIGLGQFAGWWAVPIAVAIFAICAFNDWLVESGRVKPHDGGRNA